MVGFLSRPVGREGSDRGRRTRGTAHPATANCPESERGEDAVTRYLGRRREVLYEYPADVVRTPAAPSPGRASGKRRHCRGAAVGRRPDPSAATARARAGKGGWSVPQGRSAEGRRLPAPPPCRDSPASRTVRTKDRKRGAKDSSWPAPYPGSRLEDGALASVL